MVMHQIGFLCQVCKDPIQSMVGHADLDMTQHYLHAQAPVKQKAIQVFDQAFCVA